MNLRDCLIRHGIVDSPRVCALPVATQLFFRNLLHTCDGAGRFLADVDDLRFALYRRSLDRVSRLHVARWMADCHRADLVRLYTGPDGRGYGEILKYGQRDSKRRILHPAREPEQLNFSGGSAPPPAPPPPEPLLSSEPSDLAPDPVPAPDLNRREKKTNPAREAREEEGSSIKYFSERLFATMAELEGSPLDRLTPSGRRSINAALAEIRRTKPDLHPTDLERAAAAWRKVFPTATLTARALATHWAKLCSAVPGRSAPAIVEEEPLGWRDWINENTPDAPYARGGEKEGEQWHDLAGAYRRYLIEKLTPRPAA
jgi:hypothetical protein